MNCAGYEVSCAGLFPEGSTVTFTATPASGQTFSGWGGACSGSSTTCQVFVAGAQTVVATFNGPSTINYYHTDALGSGARHHGRRRRNRDADRLFRLRRNRRFALRRSRGSSSAAKSTPISLSESGGWVLPQCLGKK